MDENAVMGKSSIITLEDWWQLRDSLKSAAYQTFFTTGERQSFELQPRCPSSECHWDSFRSIDICTLERNITEKLILDLKDPDDLDEFHLVQDPDKSIPVEQLEYWNVTLRENQYWRYEVHDVNFYNWACATTHMGPDETKYLWGDDADMLPNTTLTTQAFIYKKLPNPDKQNSDKQAVRSYKGVNSPYRANAITWYWCIKDYKVDVIRGAAHVKAEETNFDIKDDMDPEAHYSTYTMIDKLTSESFSVPNAPWYLNVQGKIEMSGRDTSGFLGQALGRIIGNVTAVDDDPFDNIMAWKEDATLAMSAV
jgi:hypothetical protein